MYSGCLSIEVFHRKFFDDYDKFLYVNISLENPEEVEPEYVVESGRADYAVKHGGRIVAFIEVKPLGGISEEVIKEKLKYAFDSGVEFTVITDGDTWLVYETFKKAEWRL
ncbi:MAG: hypothetical protein QXJ64_03705, partial [Thermosphaera sp.]